MSTPLLNRTQTGATLDPIKLLPLLTRALVAISRDEVSAPDRIAARDPAGLLAAMPAYVPGLGMAAKLTSVFSSVGPSGGSAHRGLVLVVDDADGTPIALMDAEAVTAIRTAATATLARHALAREDATRIAVVGAGEQARAQLRMLAAVGSTASVTLASRHPDRAAAAVAAADHPTAATVKSVREAVEGADVVFCCTDATAPVISHEWLARGAHLSSVGGSSGPEIDATSAARGSVFVEWTGAVTAPSPAGAHELRDTDPGQVVLLGAVLDGRHPGRRSADELTVYKSTGHAALDVAAAVAANSRARRIGIGSRLDL